MSRYIPHNDPYTNLNYDERLKKSIRHLNRLKKLRRLLGFSEKFISPGVYVQEYD